MAAKAEAVMRAMVTEKLAIKLRRGRLGAEKLLAKSRQQNELLSSRVFYKTELNQVSHKLFNVWWTSNGYGIAIASLSPVMSSSGRMPRDKQMHVWMQTTG